MNDFECSTVHTADLAEQVGGRVFVSRLLCKILMRSFQNKRKSSVVYGKKIKKIVIVE